MSATLSPSAHEVYGVALVCRSWEISRSTFYDWRKRRDSNATPARRGPCPEVSDADLAQVIRSLHAQLEAEYGIRGEGYRKTHARLRARGMRVARDRVLRVMRENWLLSPTLVGRPRGPRVHDGRITTERPDVMWGTDATQTMTHDDGKAWVLACVEHCIGELIGINASAEGNRFEALEPIHQGVRAHFGDVEPGVASGLSLRHDHGTQYTSRAVQAQLAFLGIESSPSYVRSPEGNGVAERFMRTLKAQLLWVRDFRTIEELRLALIEYQATYNASWILARHGYKTPNEVRAALLEAA